MKEKNSVLKFFGLIMIVFAIIYAMLGTLALAGEINGILPGHESQEILIVILAYIVAFLGLVGGIACFIGKKSIARIIGIIFTIAGLVSLVYMQITQDTFNIFDCIAMLLGISVFFNAKDK